MQNGAAGERAQAERAEFEALIAAFSNAPRLVRFLRFVGDKYFSDQTDELYEYNIATEVFGRSRSTFDPAEDAIARVEAHRLRKKLKEFYSAEGKDHLLQMSLPPGSYVPIFMQKICDSSEPADSNPNVNAGVHANEEEAEEGIAIVPVRPDSFGDFGKRTWFLAGGGIAAILVLTGLWGARLSMSSHREPANLATKTSPGSQAYPVTAGSEPIRILAGYSGPPQMDSAGRMWRADQYFHYGGDWKAPSIRVAKTSAPFLFEHWRAGAFAYDVPLKPGTYELHLYFASFEADENSATFFVKLDDRILLGDFDIEADAFGRNVADERVFRDVAPGPDGMLHISFGNERGVPTLNALEILPGTPHRQLPIRIVTRGTPYIDHAGHFWRPDDYFYEGHPQEQPKAIAGTTDPDLFSMERYGHFSYTIPVDPRDRYTVVMYFAEHYFGTPDAASGGVGNRVFRVLCNGETLLDNFDIYKEIGSLHALTKTFRHVKPSAQGKLNLDFEPIANNATVSAIEVLDESE